MKDLKYEIYQNEQISAMGINPLNLTALQKDIILEPIDAPENYHHDGEVTPEQAFKIWATKLKNSGISIDVYVKVLKAYSK